jgi:hypothetical protein
MRAITYRRPAAAAIVAVAAAGALVPGAVTSGARAATSVGCEGGDYRVVTPSNQTLSGYNGWRITRASVPSHSRLQVRGKYVEFSVDVSTFAVYDYALTGAPNTVGMTNGTRTPLFASKVPDLGTQTLDAGDLEVKLSPQTLELRRVGSTVKMKIQAKDCATGGIFQMEPEAPASVTITHTLAPGIFYFVNPYTGKINFGNGGQLRGKDSPQVATRLSQTNTRTVWSVSPGGRMGGVLGEDAVELSAGASPCTQQCQAQNQVKGSLPVTDPAFSS